MDSIKIIYNSNLDPFAVYKNDSLIMNENQTACAVNWIELFKNAGNIKSINEFELNREGIEYFSNNLVFNSFNKMLLYVKFYIKHVVKVVYIGSSDGFVTHHQSYNAISRVVSNGEDYIRIIDDSNDDCLYSASSFRFDDSESIFNLRLED